MSDDRLLTTDEVARYLGVPVQTLYAWRHKGIGPRSFRVGRFVRYRHEDVQIWLRERADEPRGPNRDAA